MLHADWAGCWPDSGGWLAIFIPEGPYDDPKGGALREAVYARLTGHFQFVNEMQLFCGSTITILITALIYTVHQTSPQV